MSRKIRQGVRVDWGMISGVSPLGGCRNTDSREITADPPGPILGDQGQGLHLISFPTTNMLGFFAEADNTTETYNPTPISNAPNGVASKTTGTGNVEGLQGSVVWL